MKIDEFVKNPFYPIFVIPAKAGIQLIQAVLDSCFRRSDGFSDFLRDHQNLSMEDLSPINLCQRSEKDKKRGRKNGK